ncbi:type VI secretion protein, partial [Klebsiella pneumoniae]|nr:type VI secretion protein [Klebsiella pneumoniae]
MASAASEARPSWRPRTRLWLLFGLFIAGSVLLSAISAWRDD